MVILELSWMGSQDEQAGTPPTKYNILIIKRKNEMIILYKHHHTDCEFLQLQCIFCILDLHTFNIVQNK